MTEEASEHLPHLVLVTPTYARPFQASYLTELSHLLRMVPQPFTWLVVESGVKVREGGSYSYMLLECPCSRESRRMEASSPIHVLLPLPLPLHDGIEVRPTPESPPPPPPHPPSPPLPPPVPPLLIPIFPPWILFPHRRKPQLMPSSCQRAIACP